MKRQIERYFLGELNQHEKIMFLKAVKADETLKAEYNKYQREMALLSFSDIVVNEEESRRSYDRFLREKRKKNIVSITARSFRYAAVLFLLIFSVYSFYHQMHYQNADAFETTLYVPPSQRIRLTLQDGTEVWLNAQTRLTYPSVFNRKERRVSVEGEAFFKVAGDIDRPFIVTTDRMEINVLGTEFNVCNYPKESISKVSLVQGSLKIGLLHSDQQELIIKPNEEVHIRNNQLHVQPIANNDYFLWRDGIYSFTDEKLGEILKKLERYYDIDIIVVNPTILDWNYTVKFRQRDGIDEILRLLQRIYNFSINKNEEENKIIIE